MLRRSYQALKQPDDGNLLIPCKAGGTRWIAHQERAITNLLQSYKFICGHLGQLCETTEQVSSDSKSKAKAFLKLLKSKDIVCLLHLLCDLLVPLRRLSLQLQDRGCMVSKQHSALSATIDVIQKYETSDGPCLKKIIDKDEFHGVKLTYLNMMQFNAARKNIINNIVTALEKRFSEFSSGSENVVYATRIADLQIWPDKWDDLKAFGDEELKLLVDHFQSVLLASGISVSEVDFEWTLLKKEVHNDGLLERQDGQLNRLLNWDNLNKQYKTQCLNVLSILDLILSPSSAEAERGFSQLKLIKTNIRSNLAQRTLNNSLGIRLLAADIKLFDPVPAIDHWNNNSLRRPGSKSDRQSAIVMSLESVKGESAPNKKTEGFVNVQTENEIVREERESEGAREETESEGAREDTESEGAKAEMVSEEARDETESEGASAEIEGEGAREETEGEGAKADRE